MNFILVPLELPRNKFIQLLIKRFPSLELEVLDESRSDLIYCQVSCLTDYANNCLKNDQLIEFEEAVAFFYQTVGKTDSTTKDALYLNFLGDLEMHGNAPIYQAARALLKPGELQFWAEWRARYFGEKYLLEYLPQL